MNPKDSQVLRIEKLKGTDIVFGKGHDAVKNKVFYFMHRQGICDAFPPGTKYTTKSALHSISYAKLSQKLPYNPGFANLAQFMQNVEDFTTLISSHSSYPHQRIEIHYIDGYWYYIAGGWELVGRKLSIREVISILETCRVSTIHIHSDTQEVKDQTPTNKRFTL